MLNNHKLPDVVITGIGITSAIGQGKDAFTRRLLLGETSFSQLVREGRQQSQPGTEHDMPATSPFLGAEIKSLNLPGTFPKKITRNTSLSEKVALVSLAEAWQDAQLDEIDPNRVGLIVGGSNFQQRELLQTYENYRNRPFYLKPTHGFTFMDSDLCGICTEMFGIRGFAYTLGGASASGQMAILNAIDAIKYGKADVCIAIGALMDLSFWELQAFKSLGAMGSERFSDKPELACRPYDKQRDGFIFGENCGVVVVEKTTSAKFRGIKPYARCLGGATAMDGNRNPNPSLDSEIRVIKESLAKSDLLPDNIDYINPHGTGSVIGDEIELQAIKYCDLSHSYINTTKSIIGHGLSAAGTVEVIATIIQMDELTLHPTVNMDDPLETSFNWVKKEKIPYSINNALNLSFGFGGINTALCLQSMR